MARKQVTITINDRGTDKTFLITEMSALKLEKWLAKAMLLVGGAASGADMNRVFSQGLNALRDIDFDKVEPLYDALLDCVQMKVGDAYVQVSKDTADGQISDVKTLFKLRAEVLKLNLDFLGIADLWNTLAGGVHPQENGQSTQT
jgi:mevalonate kinase